MPLDPPVPLDFPVPLDSLPLNSRLILHFPVPWNYLIPMDCPVLLDCLMPLIEQRLLSWSEGSQREELERFPLSDILNEIVKEERSKLM